MRTGFSPIVFSASVGMAGCVGSAPEFPSNAETGALTTVGSSGAETGSDEGEAGSAADDTSEAPTTSGEAGTSQASGSTTVLDDTGGGNESPTTTGPDETGVLPTRCEDNTDQAAILLEPCPGPVALAEPFDEDYTCLQTRDIPGLPPQYGGSVFSLDDPDLLLIGGNANTAQGQLWGIRVTRDDDCLITGFSDPMVTAVAAAEFNDGGMVYAPNGTLMLARWPVHELGQLAAGAVDTSRVIDLDAFAPVADQGIAALAFVPGGFAAEGRFKIMTWAAGNFFDVVLADDGSGQTFDIVSASQQATLGGGPEGFVYVDDSSPQIEGPSMLVSEWSAGFVAIYDVDDDGVPVINTRRDFITGLTGAEGAHIDPVGGDFVFTTFGGGNVIVVVHGFVPLPLPG